MSKERLQKIIESVNDDEKKQLEKIRNKKFKDYTLEDYMFLHEQAERVQDQQATIDSLSMAHDAIHREIPKDKHTLIKNIIGLNKRVQELEQWAFETKPYIKSLEQQNKRYRELLDDVINNAPLPKLERAMLKRSVKEVEESE